MTDLFEKVLTEKQKAISSKAAGDGERDESRTAVCVGYGNKSVWKSF